MPLPEPEPSGPSVGPDVLAADVEAYASILHVFREWCRDRGGDPFRLRLAVLVQREMSACGAGPALLREVHDAIDVMRANPPYKPRARMSPAQMAARDRINHAAYRAKRKSEKR